MTCPVSIGSPWQHPTTPYISPTFQPKMGSLYHESAILAAAIDSITLSYRRKDNRFTITDLLQESQGKGSHFLRALDSSFPLNLSPSNPLSSLLQTQPGLSILTTRLTP